VNYYQRNKNPKGRAVTMKNN